MPMRDKVLPVLAIAIVLLIAVFILLVMDGWSPAEPENTVTVSNSAQTAIVKPPDKTAEYYSLTADEQKKAKDIALNDAFVLNTIAYVASGEAYKQYSSFAYTPDPGSYHMGSIDVGAIHEVAPEIDRVRYLPRAEVIVGNESEGSVNLYVFVDLAAERVAHIGYTNRSGPTPGHLMYLPGENGVVVYTNMMYGKEISNYYMIYRFSNFTIVDTGYTHGSAEKDRSRIVAIVEGNETVQKFMKAARDRGATANPQIWMAVEGDTINGHDYLGVYPRGSVTPLEKDGTEGETILSVWIDRNGVKAVYENQNYGRLWRQIDRH